MVAADGVDAEEGDRRLLGAIGLPFSTRPLSPGEPCNCRSTLWLIGEPAPLLIADEGLAGFPYCEPFLLCVPTNALPRWRLPAGPCLWFRCVACKGTGPAGVEVLSPIASPEKQYGRSE